MSPLALAIWIMDDGSRSENGVKFSTHCFTYEECFFFTDILRNKYGLTTGIHKTGIKAQYNIYIHKSSIKRLKNLIMPFIHPSMYYK